jgi:hypothetical protein
METPTSVKITPAQNGTGVHDATVVKISLFLMLCFIGFVCSGKLREGRPGWSKSIEESKGLGVLLATFEPDENPLPLFDGLSARIKEAWLEWAWGYSADPFFKSAGFRSSSSCNFCFVMAKEDLTSIEDVLGKRMVS